MQTKILADGRWGGPHGIGRFSTEILSRLNNTDIIYQGPKPLSLHNFFWQPLVLQKVKKEYDVFFNPGFNPTLYSPMPFVFTICDLIHLQFPGNHKQLKKLYFDNLVKPAIRRAYKIVTISEYSKQQILEWTGINEKQVINVSCGVSELLIPEGEKKNLGFPYLLHVGNNIREHKNAVRLVTAFAQANIDKQIKLVFTGQPSDTLRKLITQLKLDDRIIFTNVIDEHALANYYRGALACVYPSLCEGFGLPPVEAMACGIPVLTSAITSLPEVAGDAAVLVDPYSVDAITDGLEQIITDNKLRNDLIQKGLIQSRRFSWQTTATNVQNLLTILM